MRNEKHIYFAVHFDNNFFAFSSTNDQISSELLKCYLFVFVHHEYIFYIRSTSQDVILGTCHWTIYTSVDSGVSELEPQI